MIQLVGQYAFRNANDSVIDVESVERGIGDARRKLGQLVHEPSLEDLSEVDRTFLTAMSFEDGPPACPTSQGAWGWTHSTPEITGSALSTQR